MLLLHFHDYQEDQEDKEQCRVPDVSQGVASWRVQVFSVQENFVSDWVGKAGA